MAAMFGTLLKIKPIIKVVDGELVVGKKPRGSIRVALDLLAEEVLNVKDRLDPDFLMITHSKAEDSASYIRTQLENKLAIKQLLETPAGCVISSHCGEGCIGILYLLNE
jgi:fatty acid-binding protein DegV